LTVIQHVGTRSAGMQVIGREEQSPKTKGRRILPLVHRGQTPYFVDLCSRQLRNVWKPHEYSDFESEEGKQMCEQSGVVMCQECRIAAVIWPALDRKELRCMNCLALIVPRVRV